MSQVGGDCMCRGPEVRTIAFEEFQELGMAGVQEEEGRVAGRGVWAVDGDQYPQVLRFPIFKMRQ